LTPLRVAFAGTPEFAARALRDLVQAGHEVVLVLTQPDRPAGRGLQLKPSDVAMTAQSLGLPLAKPASLKTPEQRQALVDAAPEVLVVAAYGIILPPSVLAIPPKGCINIHASLLPRWRGAAPIQRALLAGDHETGISIMSMDAGLDTGPVLLAQALEIAPQETAGTLHDRLAELGGKLIVDALSRLPELTAHPQDASRATYAAKVNKSDARLDWTRSAEENDRIVRAFNPAPGAEAMVGGEPVKVWAAVPCGRSLGPGAVQVEAPDTLLVGCGQGCLRLLEVQRPGGRRMAAADFIRGAGSRLGAKPLSA
jgi:methionyl-tRNA formyltransferase